MLELPTTQGYVGQVGGQTAYRFLTLRDSK